MMKETKIEIAVYVAMAALGIVAVTLICNKRPGQIGIPQTAPVKETEVVTKSQPPEANSQQPAWQEYANPEAGK